MYHLRSAEIFKFRTVIRLKHLGSISETGDRPLNKVDCREAALFLVRENKSFTGSLVNHSVLVEFLAVFTCVASDRNVLHVHLPLFAEFLGCVVFSYMATFLLGEFRLLPQSRSYKYAIKRTRMPRVCLVLPKLAVQFTHRNVGISSAIVPYPFEFLLGVGVGVLRFRFVGLVLHGLACSIILLVPAVH